MLTHLICRQHCLVWIRKVSNQIVGISAETGIRKWRRFARRKGGDFLVMVRTKGVEGDERDKGMLNRRFARGSETPEVLEVLAVADEDIRPPVGRDKRDPPARSVSLFLFPNS